MTTWSLCARSLPTRCISACIQVRRRHNRLSPRRQRLAIKVSSVEQRLLVDLVQARHLSHFHHRAPEQFEGAGGRSLRESIDRSFRHLFRRHVGERFGDHLGAQASCRRPCKIALWCRHGGRPGYVVRRHRGRLHGLQRHSLRQNGDRIGLPTTGMLHSCPGATHEVPIDMRRLTQDRANPGNPGQVARRGMGYGFNGVGWANPGVGCPGCDAPRLSHVELKL